MTYEKAIEDALKICDFTVCVDTVEYPVFFSMSDARVCTNLIQQETGVQVYARECQHDMLKKTVYVVY